MKISNILGILTFLINTQEVMGDYIQQWSSIYDGPGHSVDFAKCMTVDRSRNVYISGSSRNGSNMGTEDYCTIKYSQSGEQVWVQRYNGPGNYFDVVKAIAVDDDENVYVTGGSFGYTGYDYCTIKYDSNGEPVWVQRYNGPGDYLDVAVCIALDASGNVYVSGGSWGENNYDFCTIKYDRSGEIIWVNRFDGAGNGADLAGSIAVDDRGNVFVAGHSPGNGTGDDFCTIMYGPHGNEVWHAVYNGPGNSHDQPYAMALDASTHCVYVAGRSMGAGLNYDYCTLKYDDAGNLLWSNRYNGPDNNYDHATTMALDGSGNAVVSGWSWGNQTGDDFCTIKYSPDGTEIWVRRYDRDSVNLSSDGANKLILSNSGIFVTGVSNNDICIIGYDHAGSELWVRTFNRTISGFDEAVDAAADNAGSLYVAGNSEGRGTWSDYCVMKYSTAAATNQPENHNNSITTFFLSQNYPNPFNPVTHVRFEISELAFVSLKVYDVPGREAAVLVDQQLSAGSYEVEWNAAGFPSGAYFYRIAVHSDKLSAGNFVQTKKMILSK